MSIYIIIIIILMRQRLAWPSKRHCILFVKCLCSRMHSFYYIQFYYIPECMYYETVYSWRDAFSSCRLKHFRAQQSCWLKSIEIISCLKMFAPEFRPLRWYILECCLSHSWILVAAAELFHSSTMLIMILHRMYN